MSFAIAMVSGPKSDKPVMLQPKRHYTKNLLVLMECPFDITANGKMKIGFKDAPA
jgi:hypothetical protein